jgi:hypothetical protein
MLLIKLGVLVVLGKNYYSGFLTANLIFHVTHSLKRKLKEGIK